MGHVHPLHDIMDGLVNLVEIKEGGKVKFESELNFEALKDVSDFISVDFEDGPELA